MSVDL